jgi:hypothetical protein
MLTVEDYDQISKVTGLTIASDDDMRVVVEEGYRLAVLDAVAKFARFYGNKPTKRLRGKK